MKNVVQLVRDTRKSKEEVPLSNIFRLVIRPQSPGRTETALKQPNDSGYNNIPAMDEPSFIAMKAF